MNIPNTITIIRILLTPLLVILLLEGEKGLALVIFMVAGTGDALDGFLARLLNQKTDFGAFLDPIADKLLLITSFVTLSILDLMPAWITVIIVSRDILILGGIGVLLYCGLPLVVKPTHFSKITTFFQFITVCFFLGIDFLPAFLWLKTPVIYGVVTFTLLSGAQYLFLGFSLLANSSIGGKEQ